MYPPIVALWAFTILIGVVGADYGSINSNNHVIHRVQSTEQTIQWEREGKIDGVGVTIFANTPKPTASPLQLTTNTLDIPDEWDWRLQARLHSNVMTQRGPFAWCGACHAFAAASSITDRFRIKYPKQFPNTILSVQELLNCGRQMGFGEIGCAGSQYERSMSYIQKFGLVDSTCNGFLGVERSFTPYAFGAESCPKNQCRECTSNGQCKLLPNHKKWGISAWGQVKGEAEMIQAIYQDGPIACYMNTHYPAYAEYTGGIMSDPTVFPDPLDITHVVSLVGFGVDRSGSQDVPFWVARNWAGSYFGEDGFFRIFRGNNTLNIESNCGFGLPDIDWKAP